MHAESLVVYIVGNLNGTRCRDGACESVVVSFPSSLVGFLGFHPYMCLFSLRKLFVTCSCCFFFLFFFVLCVFVLFMNGKREEG